eukprot:tig00020964_g16810.t1
MKNAAALEIGGLAAAFPLLVLVACSCLFSVTPVAAQPATGLDLLTLSGLPELGAVITPDTLGVTCDRGLVLSDPIYLGDEITCTLNYLCLVAPTNGGCGLLRLAYVLWDGSYSRDARLTTGQIDDFLATPALVTSDPLFPGLSFYRYTFRVGQTPAMNYTYGNTRTLGLLSVDPTDGLPRRVYVDGSELRIPLYFHPGGSETRLSALAAVGSTALPLFRPTRLTATKDFLPEDAGPYSLYIYRNPAEATPSPVFLRVSSTAPGLQWRGKHRVRGSTGNYTYGTGEIFRIGDGLYDVTGLTTHEVVIDIISGNGRNTSLYTVNTYALAVGAVNIGVSSTVIATRVSYQLTVNATAPYFWLWLAPSFGPTEAYTADRALWKAVPIVANSIAGQRVWTHGGATTTYSLTISPQFGVGPYKLVVDFEVAMIFSGEFVLKAFDPACLPDGRGSSPSSAMRVARGRPARLELFSSWGSAPLDTNDITGASDSFF